MGGVSASQFSKVQILGTCYLKFRIDRRKTGVRQGRKRVPICKGGVEVEGGGRPSLESDPFKCSFSFFFILPDRPTHHRKTQGDGKRNILLGWLEKNIVTNCRG